MHSHNLSNKDGTASKIPLMASQCTLSTYNKYKTVSTSPLMASQSTLTTSNKNEKAFASNITQAGF